MARKPPVRTNNKRPTKTVPQQDELPKSRSVFRIIRGLFVLVLIAGGVLALGSVYIREQVIRAVRDRAVASASVVLSRPFPINRGLSVKGTKLTDRLNRLGYRLAEGGTPQAPGEYTIRPDRALIFLRGGTYGPDRVQESKLVSLDISGSGEVTRIADSKYREELHDVLLEPEMLSLLGSSASRASTPTLLKDYPKSLLDALLSIEDERFYSHFGVDPLGILRAVYTNVRSGRVVQGGSTITQQLAKNLFFSAERSFARKLYEALSAIFIETAFTKDQILELYMNEVFLAQEGNVAIHGFGEAARSFFGKDVTRLSLAEAATLAGIIKAPSKLSPRAHPDDAKERMALVIDKMLERELITDVQAKTAKVAKLQVIPAERSRRVAPYFVDYIRKELVDKLHPEEFSDSTLQIVTTLDLEYQKCAEDAVDKGLQKLESQKRRKRENSPLQAALVAVDPIRGEVLAWVGGRDYGTNQFDRVSMSKRQPGSAFKPFVYLTALDRSLNNYRVARTTSTLIDEPTRIDIPGSKEWLPKNYDNDYRGEVTVRYALSHSLNVPTVDLALKVGIDAVANTAERFGFGDDLPRVPSLALGAGEISPLELARAYAALANGGILSDLSTVVTVLRQDEQTPLYSPEHHEERAATEAAVYVLTSILQSTINEGTGTIVRSLGFTAPAAGKTGTTNDTRDAWFAGFTPRLLAIVWVGFDDNHETKLTGAQGAAPIWTEFMKCVAPMEPPLDFVPPPGVVSRAVDPSNGLLVTDDCSYTRPINEIFVEGTEPVSLSPACGGENEPYNTPLPSGEPEADYPNNRPSRGSEDWQPLEGNLPSGLPPAQRSRQSRPWWDTFWKSR